jgi:hypothetical protein
MVNDPMADAAALDLPAYLRRIGYAGALSPSRSTLDALHLAHATAIPFENLDILLGVPIRLDLANLQSKLVFRRRGGYCFEQNALFANVLERIGFTVTRLAARVRYGTDRVLPRTHMTLRVDVAGVPILADVGFGADGLLLPVPMDGALSQQFGWSYRVAESGGVHARAAIAGRLRDCQSLHVHAPGIALHAAPDRAAASPGRALDVARPRIDRGPRRDDPRSRDPRRGRAAGDSGRCFRARISRRDAVRAAARRKLTSTLATRGGHRR